MPDAVAILTNSSGRRVLQEPRRFWVIKYSSSADRFIGFTAPNHGIGCRIAEESDDVLNVLYIQQDLDRLLTQSAV
jgi:hypothetical protein